MDEFQQSLSSISPCSSCDTIVDLAHEDYGRPQLAMENVSDSPASLKIVLPNLVDHMMVAVHELDAFMSSHGCEQVNATVTHLLIFLFSKNVHPDIHHIANIKLLHAGRQYWVGQPSHFCARAPLIHDICHMFPTFQLLICSGFPASSVVMPISRMLSLCTLPATESPPATYAEAMVRKFRARRRSIRKSSVDTVESATSRATRFLSRGSITDTEEGSASVMVIKRSLRKLIERTRHLSITSSSDICI